MGFPWVQNVHRFQQIFLYRYERDFMFNIHQSKMLDPVDIFNYTSHYRDDIITIDNPKFKHGSQRATYHALEYNMPTLLTAQPGQLSLFSDQHKNTKLLEDLEYLPPVKLYQITLFGSLGEVVDVSGNQKTVRPSSSYSDWPKIKNFVKDVKILLSWNIRWIMFRFCKVQTVVENIYGRPSVFFFVSRKNTYLVGNVQILLHVKFRLIKFSCCREVV